MKQNLILLDNNIWKYLIMNNTFVAPFSVNLSHIFLVLLPVQYSDISNKPQKYTTYYRDGTCFTVDIQVCEAC